MGPRCASAAGWQAIGPEGGRIDGFAQAPTNPDRIYCLSRLGVLRSDDRGDTWSRVNPAKYGCVAVSPQDEDLVLAGEDWNQRIQRSTDGGQTWTGIPIDLGQNPTLRALVFDPIVPDRAFAAIEWGTHPGVYRSTDAGLTWALSNTGLASLHPITIAFHPQAAGVVLLGNYDGIYRSTDGGSSWTLLGASGGTYVTSISFCAGAPSRVWATGYPTVLRSDNGGLSFAPVAHPPPLPDWALRVKGVTAHPTNPDVVAAAVLQSYCDGFGCYQRVHGVVRSTDGGFSWPAVSCPIDDGFESADVTGVFFDSATPSNVYLATTATSETGLMRSTDSGASWSCWMHGIYGNSILSIARDNTGTVYVRRNGTTGMWSTLAIGTAWTRGAAHGWSSYDPICFEANRRRPGLLHEAGASSTSDVVVPTYAQSTDGGLSWCQEQYMPTTGQFSQTWVVASNHGDGGTVYAWVMESGWTLYRSDDGVTFDTSIPTFPVGLAVIDPVDPLRLFAVHAWLGYVQLSTDGGETWIPRSSGLPSAYPLGLFMDPAAPQRLVIVYTTAGTFRSEDAGVTWTQVPLDVGSAQFVGADWDPVTDRFALATQNQGVFLSDRGFVTAGLPPVNLTSILLVPESGHVLVGTAGESVWAFDLSDPTSISMAVPLPRELELRVRPNPSRGEVQLDLAVPVGHRAAELAIYNVAGRRVVTLATGIEGPRSLVWDGRDVAGELVAPGVYFVRATAGTESQTERVVLLDR